jgi:hypothetical protein
MKISSDLGNIHPVTIDQLVMPAIELLEDDHNLKSVYKSLKSFIKWKVVELVQDGPRFFWDHLLPTAHVNSFLHYLAVLHI